ncbi:hypothetical protein [Bartonella sp. C271]
MHSRMLVCSRMYARHCAGMLGSVEPISEDSEGSKAEGIAEGVFVSVSL